MTYVRNQCTQKAALERTPHPLTFLCMAMRLVCRLKFGSQALKGFKTHQPDIRTSILHQFIKLRVTTNYWVVEDAPE